MGKPIFGKKILPLPTLSFTHTHIHLPLHPYILSSPHFPHFSSLPPYTHTPVKERAAVRRRVAVGEDYRLEKEDPATLQPNKKREEEEEIRDLAMGFCWGKFLAFLRVSMLPIVYKAQKSCE
jgi:hypothetical protein